MRFTHGDAASLATHSLFISVWSAVNAPRTHGITNGATLQRVFQEKIKDRVPPLSLSLSLSLALSSLKVRLFLVFVLGTPCLAGITI